MPANRSAIGLRHATLAVAVTLSGLVVTRPAAADDAVAAAPALYEVEFENATVRVLRVVYGPGDKSPMHDHPDSVAVYLTGGRIRITLPDGQAGEPQVPPGLSMWHPAGRHAVENLGDAPFEMVLIELKQPAGPAR